MSGGWQLFLFLFILGIVLQGFNQIGLWSPKYPDAGYTMETSTIEDVQAGAKAASPTIFVIYAWVISFVTIIGSGVVAVLSLGILFWGMGWPMDATSVALLQLIQLPANLIIFAWLFELWTGRPIG